MSIKKTIGQCFETLSSVPVIGAIFKSGPKVSVIRLSGVIADSARRGSISLTHYEKVIEQAFDVHELKAVALVINSPGGSPAQSALVGGLIRRLAEKEEVPVYAFVEDVAASGGYWVACAADEIYGTEVSIVGSIGVISAGFGFQELIGKHGVERRIHTSGKDKSFLDPFVDEKQGDVKRLKTLQADLHESFKDWVRERRANSLKGSDQDIFEGQFWLTPQALEFGLVDGIGDVKTICEDKFGDKVKLTEFSPDRGFFSGLLGGIRLSLADDVMGTLEERGVWGRYGL